MQLQLMVLALSGNTSVSNGFTDMADREGLSPEGRERKRREERRVFLERLETMREQMVQFLERLDRLEQASMEALHENEEQLEQAWVELKRIRERAYEITMPDGTVAKVYRDGNVVRSEDGAEVSREIVRAEDIGADHPTWPQRSEAERRFRNLETEHEHIVTYREKLEHARERTNEGDLVPDELDALSVRVDKDMPHAVRQKLESGATSPYDSTGPNAASEAGSRASAIGPFEKASARDLLEAVIPESDPDIRLPRPNASAPALR